jgi:hypothetical protein
MSPKISPVVAAFWWPWRWVSGMISWLMMYSIAPAAKVSPQGRTSSEACTAQTPKSPPTGSIRPVSAAIPKAKTRE